MNETRSGNENREYDELTFVELVKVLRDYKLLIVGFTLSCLLAAIAYAFLATQIYRAEVLIAAADDSATAASGLSSIMSRIGSLSSLGGFGSFAGQQKAVTEGIATLQSPGFTMKFIDDKGLMPILFAEIWDSQAENWIVESPEDIPTAEDAYILFNETVREIVEDDNGLVTLAVEWKDPVLAAEWANELVNRLNERLRVRAIDEANQTIEYLNNEVEKTRIVELQQAIYFMIENQINLRTMANVRKEFAFKVISPATPPDADRFVKPQRVLAIIVGLLAGVIGGVFLSFLLFAIKRIRAEMAG